MSKTLAFLLITLLAAAAQANDPTFREVNALQAPERQRLAPVLDAAFHFRLDAGVDCTGTFISNTGHFITARHCITGCLLKTGVIEKEMAISDPTDQVKVILGRDGIWRVRDLYTYKMTVEEDRVADGDVNCPGTLGAKHVDFKVILSGGRGWLVPSKTLASFSKKYPEEYSALLDDGYEHSGDFAVLQVMDGNKASASKCLALSRTGPLRGQALEAVSYPCLHRDELSTQGLTPLYTTGTKTAGFKDSTYYRELGEAHIPFRVSTVERKETFFSTLDMEKCGSGTALLSNDFSIVGVATRVYKSSLAYEKGSLEAVDSAAVLKELRARVPAYWREITTCHASNVANQKGPDVQKK